MILSERKTPNQQASERGNLVSALRLALLDYQTSNSNAGASFTTVPGGRLATATNCLLH